MFRLDDRTRRRCSLSLSPLFPVSHYVLPIGRSAGLGLGTQKRYDKRRVKVREEKGEEGRGRKRESLLTNGSTETRRRREAWIG